MTGTVIGLLLAFGTALTTGIASVLQGARGPTRASTERRRSRRGIGRPAGRLAVVPAGSRTRRRGLRLHCGRVALAAVVPRAVRVRVERRRHCPGRTTSAGHRSRQTARSWCWAALGVGTRAAGVRRQSRGSDCRQHGRRSGGWSSRPHRWWWQQALPCCEGRGPAAPALAACSPRSRVSLRRYRGRVADALRCALGAAVLIAPAGVRAGDVRHRRHGVLRRGPATHRRSPSPRPPCSASRRSPPRPSDCSRWVTRRGTASSSRSALGFVITLASALLLALNDDRATRPR